MSGITNRTESPPHRAAPDTIRSGGAVPEGIEAQARWVVDPARGRLSGVLLHQDDETGRFDLVLVDAEARTALRFEAAEEEAVAMWRALGAATGAPLMLQAEDGSLETPYPQLGRLALGAVRIRRRHNLLKGRRPRFLVRRKTSRLSNCPAVFREREIFGRES